MIFKNKGFQLNKKELPIAYDIKVQDKVNLTSSPPTLKQTL